MTEVFIYDALRTPCGAQSLYEVKPVNLLAAALEGLRQRHDLDTRLVDDCLIGCVTPVADQGFNLARTALLQAGWNPAGGGLQINRYHASGLEAVGIGAARIAAGWASLVVAGGAESMSRAPLGADGGALRFDPEVMLGSHYLSRGVAADLLATLAGISRDEADHYALQSHQRAVAARAHSAYDNWLLPIRDHNGLVVLAHDEHLRDEVTAENLAEWPAAYAELGAQGFDEMALHRYPALERIRHIHTAGNTSPAADGAALFLLGDARTGKALGRPPRARILAVASVGADPTAMWLGGEVAAHRALQQAGLTPADIDLWECNEDFAALALHFQQALALPADRLNVQGGSIALGSPLGAMGAMVLGSLLLGLEQHGLRRGLAAVAADAGLATALVIERLDQ